MDPNGTAGYVPSSGCGGSDRRGVHTVRRVLETSPLIAEHGLDLETVRDALLQEFGGR